MDVNFLNVLTKASGQLTEAGIRHMLTGSFALAYYVSEFRATNDLDVVIDAKPKDRDVLIGMFPPEEEWYVSEVALEEALERRGMFNAIHYGSGIKIDMIQLKLTELEKLKLERRKLVKGKDAEFWIISPEDLLLSKLAWGMPSDSAVQMKDVRALIRDFQELDWNYVNEWAGRTGVSDWLEKARSG